MTRSTIAIPIALALFSAGCGSSDDGAGGTLEIPAYNVACQTSLPTADELSGPLILGFMSEDPSQLIVMDAQVDVKPDGNTLSITIDGPERCGPAQHLDDVSLNTDGTFSMFDVALKFPHGYDRQDDASAVVSLQGGFCSTANSLQGTYSGTTLSPTEKNIDGAWFIAKVTDPDAITPTCAAQGE